MIRCGMTYHNYDYYLNCEDSFIPRLCCLFIYWYCLYYYIILPMKLFWCGLVIYYICLVFIVVLPILLDNHFITSFMHHIDDMGISKYYFV